MNNSMWTIDVDHSEVQFKVKHLVISNVLGTFKAFNGTMQSTNDDFTDAEIKFEVAANRIDTNNVERDKHLKSNMFFDSEKFPKIKFVGFFRNQNGSQFIEGNLTILETTKTVKLEAEYMGTASRRFNDIRAGFKISTKINRKDFVLTFNLLNDTGNMVVGNEVTRHFDIQLMKVPN